VNILEMEGEVADYDEEVMHIFHSCEAVNSCNDVERISFKEYMMIFQKIIQPPFKDVGYMSLYGKFFKYYICTKCYNGKTSRMLMMLSVSNQGHTRSP